MKNDELTTFDETPTAPEKLYSLPWAIPGAPAYVVGDYDLAPKGHKIGPYVPGKKVNK